MDSGQRQRDMRPREEDGKEREGGDDPLGVGSHPVFEILKYPGLWTPVYSIWPKTIGNNKRLRMDTEF